MAKLSIECKKMMVDEATQRLAGSGIFIVTNYKGLNSQDLNELRSELRKISSEYLVIKDSVAKRALAKSPNKTIVDFIEGEVGIVIDRRPDPIYSSKVLMRFSKDHESLKIRGGLMNGTAISQDDIKTLAALPGRDVLLAKLANVLNAPIQGLASGLNGILTKLLYALNAVKDKAAAK